MRRRGEEEFVSREEDGAANLKGNVDVSVSVDSFLYPW